MKTKTFLWWLISLALGVALAACQPTPTPAIQITWRNYAIEQAGAGSLVMDRAGDLWIGLDNGLALMLEDGTFLELDDGPQAPISSLATTPEGTIWAGTMGQGLYRSAHGPELWNRFTVEDGLGADNVFWLYARGDDLLAATADAEGRGGLSHTDDGGVTWTIWTAEDGLPRNAVRSAFLDANGVLYAGLGEVDVRTPGGGFAISHDGGTTWTAVPELAEHKCIAIFVEDGGTVWVGTQGAGLWVSRDGGATFQRVATLPGDLLVGSIVVDEVGRLWLGTNRGLRVSADSGSTWSDFTPEDGLGADNVRAIVVDGDTVWAACDPGSLEGQTGGLSRGAIQPD